MATSSGQHGVGNRRSLWLGLSAAVIIFASAAVAGWWLLGERIARRPARAWYYDLSTRQLFVADVTKDVPVAAPSGPTPDGRPAGVRAFVFSHGDCSNAAERFIGWLETTSATQPAGAAASRGGHRLIRREKDADWVAADSSRGLEIINEVLQGPGDGRPVVPCEPQ